MATRVKKLWPALKHGAYSTTAVLPGEDRNAFEKLHRDLRAELAPNGALEDDIIANLARLIWRRRNLSTFRIAELADARYDQIKSETIPTGITDYFSGAAFGTPVDPDEVAAGVEAAEDQARKELRDTFELVEVGDLVTLERLSSELDLHERLDAMIDRCLKRLLFVRGLKSISGASATASSPRLAVTPRTT